LKKQSTNGYLKLRKANYDRLRFKIALKLISDLGIKGKHILDLGCGAGEFSAILRQQGGVPVCLDINFNNIQRLKALGLPAFIHNLNQGLPFSNESFDLAVCLEVIEHIPQAEFLLSEIYRVLKKGGNLVLSTPNAAYYLFRLKALLGLPPHREGYHYRYFIKSALDNLLIQNRFNIIKRNAVIYIFFYNRVRKIFGKLPIWLRLPTCMESLLARNFYILAEKP